MDPERNKTICCALAYLEANFPKAQLLEEATRQNDLLYYMGGNHRQFMEGFEHYLEFRQKMFGMMSTVLTFGHLDLKLAEDTLLFNQKGSEAAKSLGKVNAQGMIESRENVSFTAGFRYGIAEGLMYVRKLFDIERVGDAVFTVLDWLSDVGQSYLKRAEYYREKETKQRREWAAGDNRLRVANVMLGHDTLKPGEFLVQSIPKLEDDQVYLDRNGRMWANKELHDQAVKPKQDLEQVEERKKPFYNRRGHIQKS